MFKEASIQNGDHRDNTAEFKTGHPHPASVQCPDHGAKQPPKLVQTTRGHLHPRLASFGHLSPENASFGIRTNPITQFVPQFVFQNEANLVLPEEILKRLFHSHLYPYLPS